MIIVHKTYSIFDLGCSFPKTKKMSTSIPQPFTITNPGHHHTSPTVTSTQPSPDVALAMPIRPKRTHLPSFKNELSVRVITHNTWVGNIFSSSL